MTIMITNNIYYKLSTIRNEINILTTDNVDPTARQQNIQPKKDNPKMDF